MKKSIQIIFILSIFLFTFSSQIFADGKPFEGEITYEITYPESKPSQIEMLPNLMKVYVKDELIKTVLNTGMRKTTNIFYSSEMYSIKLLDKMEQKYAVRSSTEIIKNRIDKAPKPQIEYLDETKEILGYTCKKAVVTIKNEMIGTESKLIVYYLDEFSQKNLNKNNPIFYGINGIMLEYEMDAMGTFAKFTAISVKNKKIPRKEFDIPKDYEITTKEELKSKFGVM